MSDTSDETRGTVQHRKTGGRRRRGGGHGPRAVVGGALALLLVGAWPSAAHADVDCSACLDPGDACSQRFCDPVRGCIGRVVVCNDFNPCTADSCDPASGDCAFAPLAAGTSCDDGDACDGTDTCDGAGACLSTAPLDCDDHDACTADSCSARGGCTHAALSCDDGDACTADSCEASSGCTHAALPGASCADGDACNGAETCDASGFCQPGPPLACDDGDLCTRDACDPAEGCRYDATPATACAVATAGSLLVDERRAGHERLNARLAGNLALSDVGELGDPLLPHGTGYALCLYDAGSTLVGSLQADRAGDACGAAPCWQAIGNDVTRGYVYRDAERSADALWRLRLRGGATQRQVEARVQARNDTARGVSAFPTGIAAALRAQDLVTVQLVSSDAACLSAVVTPDGAGSGSTFHGKAH